MSDETVGARALPGLWPRMVEGGVYYIMPNVLFLAFAFMPFVFGSLPLSSLPWIVASVVLIAVVYVGVAYARCLPIAGRIAWLVLLAASLASLWPQLGIDTGNFVSFQAMAMALLLPVPVAVPLIVVLCGAVAVASGLAGAPTPTLLAIFALVAGVLLAFAMVIFERNARLRAAEQRVATLAVAAERERIGRDLHDILGHSLTAITVKSALAARLIDLDAERAKAEMAEVEAITRQALADVRATSSGMRDVRVATEVASARSVLQAAGLRATTPSAMPTLDDARSEVFGYAVREAVTNVVRHAEASTCAIDVQEHLVRVTDDGVGGASSARGTGLAGLESRATAAGMRLAVRSGERGTTVEVSA